MLLVAQRVRAPDGRQGINAFCYLHEGIWIGRVPPAIVTGPRTLASSYLEVEPPGHNKVRSFLDIWVPDTLPDRRIYDRVLSSADLLVETGQPLPWDLESGDVTFTFNADHALAMGSREELSKLLAHALSVRVPA